MIRLLCRKSIKFIPIYCFIIYLITNDLIFLFLFIGLLLSLIFNILLKCIFGIIHYNSFLRPYSIKKDNICINDILLNIGMPSAHSQLAWTFSTFLILLYHKHHYNKQITILLLTISFLISISRTGKYIGYPNHTFCQVIIGSLIGIIIGIVFYSNIEYFTPLNNSYTIIYK